MTVNQAIVLLDVKRGFRGDIHAGTLKSDLACLKQAGFIRKSNELGCFEWVLTVAGEAVCEEMMEGIGE